MCRAKIAVYSKILKPEESLHTSVQSVLNQSFRDICYYVLVSEKTRKILEKYEAEDNRVVLLDAKGQEDDFQNYYKSIAEKHSYVFCIDGDDWLETVCLEKLYQFAETNGTDITICGNTFAYERNGEIAEVLKARGLKEDICAQPEVFLSVLPEVYQFFRAFWGRLIRSELLLRQESLLTSIKYGGYGGDTLKNFQLFQDSNKIGIVQGFLYNYRINCGSGSYQYKNGRTDSDVVLFNYVKDVLVKYNMATDRNISFLFEVYMNAVFDTLKLLLNSNMTEENRVSEIEKILCCPLTVVMMRREEEGRRWDTTNSKSKIRVEYGAVLFQSDKVVDSSACFLKRYYELFLTLYPEFKCLSFAEFQVIIRDSRLLGAVLHADETQIVIGFLTKWNSLSEDEQKGTLSFLRTYVKDNLTKIILESEITNDARLRILSATLYKQYQEGKNLLISMIEQQQDCMAIMELLNLYINISAITEDVDGFINGKFYKLQLLCEMGSIQDARVEYKDLLEMGVDKSSLEQFASYCEE